MKLLHPTVWEEMHLQEKNYPKVRVTQNVTQYPFVHVAYAHAKFQVAMSNGLGGEAFTRKSQNVVQYPLHHVTYAARKV